MKIKIRVNYLLCITLILLGACNQTKEKEGFYFHPTKVVEIKGKASKQTITGITFLKTESSKDIHLKWKKIKDNTPEDWEIHYCDNTVCHLDFPDGNKLNAINRSQSDEENRMKIYIQPFSVAGKGQVQIAVIQQDNEAMADTITYNINISD